MCVYDFLKENEFAPFPRQHIQSFARQLLGSVACELLSTYMSLIVPDLRHLPVLHDLHLIHTDLKPENILLVHNNFRSSAVPVPGKVYLLAPHPIQPRLIFCQRNALPRMKRVLQSTDIRLIDFGSATFEEEYHSTVVSTRHYRAPEIILGL
jgi:dual-specificity kinase